MINFVGNCVDFPLSQVIKMNTWGKDFFTVIYLDRLIFIWFQQNIYYMWFNLIPKVRSQLQTPSTNVMWFVIPQPNAVWVFGFTLLGWKLGSTGVKARIPPEFVQDMVSFQQNSAAGGKLKLPEVWCGPSFFPLHEQYNLAQVRLVPLGA